jgi:hypothetical protein
MQALLIIALVILVGATAFVLIKGVVGMAQQTDVTGMRSQNLMRKRVMFQALAIMVTMLLLVVAGGSGG